ncbi:hypothetical protein JVU11DRAFT_7142 [Chiua virens]|nr:hypothetical protein JVU11DRAFT_7142 [Chiua virens]
MATDTDESRLSNFASKAWGSPCAFIKELDDSQAKFDYIDLGGYFTTFRKFFVGALSVDKILIRQEYRDAFEELEKEAYYNGVCVTGQPGIGKTLFNIYILVKRLGEKKAVAMQFMNGQPMYALFQDTARFYSLDNILPLYEPPFVWVLCDSNDKVESPSGVFRGEQDRIRIIQTTSPKVSRWKEWTKQHGADIYVMDIWTENEIRQLSAMLELNVDRTIDLARKWGNVPLMLLKNLKLSDKEIEKVYRKGAVRAVGDTPQFMAASVQNFPSDPPSSFFFVRPSSDDGVASRREFDSPRADKNPLAIASTSASGPRQSNKIGILQASLLQGTRFPALGYGVPPYYWVSPDLFPGIDGLLVFKTRICAFQVTISSTHRSPDAGLEKIRKNLRADLKDVPLGLVFVGPQESAIKQVATRWRSRVRFTSTGKIVPVAWSVVDPASGDVEYNSFRDVEYTREFDEPEQAEQLGNATEPEDQAATPSKRSPKRIAQSAKSKGKRRKIE